MGDIVERLPRASVGFEHWRCVIPSAELRAYGSPHFDRKSVGQGLRDVLGKEKEKCAGERLEFRYDQIRAANEAFPEAAVSDPIADLEMWEEWNSGVRAFPYPGRYGPLGIVTQQAKTTSSSSVGVIGEILTGLVAQEGISPYFLVRVIRRWPDFILETAGAMYAFVESKAIGPEVDLRPTAFLGRIPEGLLWDCLIDAVHQLNADAFVQVWGSFTRIVEVTPMRLEVTLLQLEAPQERRNAQKDREIPGAVLVGLAERSVSSALAAMEPSERERSWARGKGGSPAAGAELVERARGELHRIIRDSGPLGSRYGSEEAWTKAIEEVARELSPALEREGRRFRAAKTRAAEGRFAQVRSLGSGNIFMADMPPAERESLKKEWHPSWERATKSWKRLQDTDLWRCGAAIFALSEHELEGTPL